MKHLLVLWRLCREFTAAHLGHLYRMMIWLRHFVGDLKMYIALIVFIGFIRVAGEKSSSLLPYLEHSRKWEWASSRSWWWTGKPGVLQSMGLQRVGHGWATELNWIDDTRHSWHKPTFRDLLYIVLEQKEYETGATNSWMCLRICATNQVVILPYNECEPTSSLLSFLLSFFPPSLTSSLSSFHKTEPSITPSNYEFIPSFTHYYFVPLFVFVILCLMTL